MGKESNLNQNLPKKVIFIFLVIVVIYLWHLYIIKISTATKTIELILFIFLFLILAISGFAWYQTQKKILKKVYNSEVEKFALIKHFEDIIRYANDIILFIDEKYRVIEANDRALEVYQYLRAEMLLFPAENLFSPEYKENTQNWFETLRKEGAFFGESVHVNKNGDTFPVEISARTIILEEQVFYQTIIRNITERKVAEKKILEREEELKRQNQEYSLLNAEFGSLCEELSEQNEKLEMLNEKLSVSENRFRLFMDNFPGVAIIKDSQNKLLFGNFSFESQMKKPLDTLLGKTNEELFPKNVADIIEMGDQKVFSYNNGFVEEVSDIFKKDSKNLISRFIIPQINNKPLIGTIILDITETRLLEAEVTKFKRIVEQSPVSIVITNTNGIIEYVNKKFTEITGYTKEEAIGQNPSILKSGRMKEDDYKILWDNILSNKEWKGQFLNKKKNGELFWENASIFPLFEKDKQVTHFIGLKEDITKQKKDEEKLEENQLELQKQNEKLQKLNEELQKSSVRIQEINSELMNAKDRAIESDKLKSAFLANLSHEIRTPMNGIIGFSEMLALENITPEKRKHYIEVIISSTNQLLSIVNDILDLSKIETGQISLAKEQININKLLIELLSFFKPKTDAKKIGFEIEKGLPDEKCILFSDKIRLFQVLSNLIGNAIKFTKEGIVKVGYRLIDDNLEFFVEDTGIGIAQEYQHRLFGRFMQANSEITKNYGGTGLGLAISKSLVELLGGKIWFSSELGSGTVFKFTLPYNPSPKINNQSISLENFPSVISNKTIILLAEDEEINHIFIKEVFDGQPVDLIFAENGLEAVELCKLHPEIDIILMDLKMPLMSGFEATQQIKNFRPDLPIIALTAYAMKEDKETALEIGCIDYLSKPVKSSDLIKCVKKHLKQN
jgi:PAS domain S-box-containing protein